MRINFCFFQFFWLLPFFINNEEVKYVKAIGNKYELDLFYNKKVLLKEENNNGVLYFIVETKNENILHNETFYLLTKDIFIDKCLSNYFRVDEDINFRYRNKLFLFLI